MRLYTYEELLDEIFKTCSLEGQFLLRSGKTSSFYFDKYRFEARPDLLKSVAKFLAEKISPRTQVLAGLDLGGIPIATALSLETGLPCAFVRKEAKSYGTCQMVEGASLAGKTVSVIEDVVTTGGQALSSIQGLENEGAYVQQVLCVLDRSAKGENKLAGKYNFHSLFQKK